MQPIKNQSLNQKFSGKNINQDNGSYETANVVVRLRDAKEAIDNSIGSITKSLT